MLVPGPPRHVQLRSGLPQPRHDALGKGVVFRGGVSPEDTRPQGGSGELRLPLFLFSVSSFRFCRRRQQRLRERRSPFEPDAARGEVEVLEPVFALSPQQQRGGDGDGAGVAQGVAGERERLEALLDRGTQQGRGGLPAGEAAGGEVQVRQRKGGGRGGLGEGEEARGGGQRRRGQGREFFFETFSMEE